MAIKTMDEMFLHELGDIYDAEHQFLEGQEKMLEAATAPKLKKMLTEHIAETKQQIQNLEEVFRLLGEKPEREHCSGAKGLVTEASKLLRETENAPEIRDYAIAGSAAKAEHYEILSYEGLIAAATEMGNEKAVTLFRRNLNQEQKTAKLIEENEPQLLKSALGSGAEVAMKR